MNKKFEPNNCIFLWDLHEVILEKSMWNWFKIGMRFNKKWNIIKKLDKKTTKIAFTFLLERLHLTDKQVTSEELIFAARNANNHAFIDLIVNVCCSYQPIKETISLMEELSSLNYKHHLGSNIGKTVFENCQIKFPTIFNQFEAAHIPFNNTENDVIKKPDPRFFTTYLEKNNINPHNIVFIDDKKCNIKAAQNIGIQAILFKNAGQLRKRLADYGIPINSW